jgi:hypothetical protein
MYKNLLQAAAIAVIFQASIGTGNAATMAQVQSQINTTMAGSQSGKLTKLQQCKKACLTGKNTLTDTLHAKAKMAGGAATTLCSNNSFCQSFPGTDNGAQCAASCAATLAEIVAENETSLAIDIATLAGNCSAYCDSAYGMTPITPGK